MRKIREVLRLKFEERLGHRAIAAACGIGASTVSDYVARAGQHGVAWPLAPELDDVALEQALFPAAAPTFEARVAPDLRAVHEELKRKGVTLRLLWHEYAEDRDDPYRYSQFCELYRRWAKKLSVSMRQVHRVGEKAFVDFAGTTMTLRLRDGGTLEVQIFVAVLGASSYTYAEATADQTLPSWLMANERMLRFFGGSPEILVPDCLKSAVTKACRYEPLINRSYDDFARHYGAVVIPARPRKPKDKAKAEAGVLVVTRWLIASLRNHEFFTIAELNAALRQRLDWLNDRPMKHVGASRRELFERLDRPALQPLPAAPFERRQWEEDLLVKDDYHVPVLDNFYSVSYLLANQRVDACCTDTMVEVFVGDRRVASHQRLHGKGQVSTQREHMPKSHRAHAEWTPSRLAEWAATAGASASRFVAELVRPLAHPEQGYHACLGVMRLGQAYGTERLDAACARAERLGSFKYATLLNILKNGQDRLPLPDVDVDDAVRRERHDNIRGPEYYGSSSDLIH